MPDRVLVVAAHPDDEAFGCGALLHRWWREGVETHVLWLGEGPTSRGPDSERQAVAAATLDQRSKAAACLGLRVYQEHVPLQDQRFDAIPLIEVAHIIEAAIRHVDPHIILTHDETDLNQDHQVTHQATLIATRPRPDRIFQLTFEVPGSTEWRFGYRFRPTTFVGIAPDDIDAKIAAVRAYGELARAPHPRSEEVIRAVALTWGSLVGIVAAEPLRLLWQTR